MEQKAKVNQSVVLRTVLISSIILAILLTLLHLFVSSIIQAEKVLLGIKLVIFWVVVTGTLRSVAKIRKHIGGLWLLLTGLLVSGLGIVFHLLALQIISALKNDTALDLSINFRSVGFYVLVGVIASIISLINLKVKSEFWGNVLEVLFIAALAVLFFWLV
ncbi:MAG: hypothetical protein KDC85_12750 [Saprospiraceae bacterium]|nr:hypothetical protein [Saprospiraceae bacterium]MCB9323258.1 hypothetical protein [Lewinellaceae bacterium]